MQQLNRHFLSSCVCGSSDFSKTGVGILLRNSDLEYGTAKCSSCGSFFLNPMPTADAISRHYSNDYNFYQGKNPKQYGRGVGFGLYYLLPRKSPGVLLDVGCGASDFLKAIHDTMHWSVVGCDINGTSIENAKIATGLDSLYHGDIFDSRLSDFSYDCIHLRDVIEHVTEPLNFLQRAGDLLADDGFIYVRIPNGPVEFKGKSREAKRTGKAVLTTPGHLWYLSSRGFETLCQRAGLNIESRYSFGLKNGLRNLGWYPVPRTSRVVKALSSSEHAWSSDSDKASKRFLRQERALWEGISSFHLEHVYLLRKR